jgi:hypothetical protein
MKLDEASTWRRAGWIATVLWVIYVYETTKGDPAHPLFNYIFLVPLSLWAIFILAARLLRDRTPPADDASSGTKPQKPKR